MSGEQLSFFRAEVARRAIDSMTSKGQRTIVQELEMVAVFGAFKSWQDEVSRRRVVVFTDSEAVR